MDAAKRGEKEKELEKKGYQNESVSGRKKNGRRSCDVLSMSLMYVVTLNMDSGKSNILHLL